VATLKKNPKLFYTLIAALSGFASGNSDEEKNLKLSFCSLSSIFTGIFLKLKLQWSNTFFLHALMNNSLGVCA
jgi:hypothetical protein